MTSGSAGEQRPTFNSGERSLVWFKRDLRLADHEPLMQAAAGGPVLGLYVYEPIVYRAAEHDAAHLAFVNECLAEVRQGLRVRGSDLLLAEGEMVEVLDRLWERLRFDHLWSHEETGLAATFDRDRAVKAWCRKRGVQWTEVPQHGVFRPLRSRDGWAARWQARMSSATVPAPLRLSPWPAEVVAAVGSGEMRSAEDLGLPPTTMSDVQRGGEAEALGVLDSFLRERGEPYQKAMSSPLAGWDACSRISPYLAYGAISVRTCEQTTRARLAELGRSRAFTAWRASLHSFAKRLRWHCHFIQKLEDEPETEFRNFNRAYDGLREEDRGRWTEEEERRFAAWCSGRTGYPMVDACMRSLHATGWVNFRMRAMLMSFASYHLWLHWRVTAPFLATRFLDFEPGIHYPQAQMQSGVTGINTVRIYSPAKQVIDQDPEGIFLRRWLPELAKVPQPYLARPETMPVEVQREAGCRIGEDYPAPVVLHEVAYREAQRRIYALRRTPEAREEAARVYGRHGSRRRPGRPRARRGDAPGG